MFVVYTTRFNLSDKKEVKVTVSESLFQSLEQREVMSSV